MEDENIDYEMKILNIYEKLSKEGLFDQWKNHVNRVMRYLEKEWSPEFPPSLNDITSIATSFANSSSMLKISEVIGTDDASLLMTFMIIGIDEIINGEKAV